MRDFDLVHDPPFVVMESFGGRPVHDASIRNRLRSADLLTVAHDVARCVAEAHRLGLAHGAIAPGVVALTGDRQAKLDFTSLDVGQLGALPSVEAYRAPRRRIGERRRR